MKAGYEVLQRGCSLRGMVLDRLFLNSPASESGLIRSKSSPKVERMRVLLNNEGSAPRKGFDHDSTIDGSFSVKEKWEIGLAQS